MQKTHMSKHWLVELVDLGELPEYFILRGVYGRDQFTVGWCGRNKCDPTRTSGENATHLTHPQADVKFHELKVEQLELIYRIAQGHLLFYAQCTKAELGILRVVGAEGFSKGVTVPTELLKKLNEKHHDMWMMIRAASRLFGQALVGPHTSDKARNLLNDAEIAADDAQVQAYAVLLALMPDDAFVWLLNKAK